MDLPSRAIALGAGAWRIEVGDRIVVAKLHEGAIDEADGLRRLRSVPGAPPVPDVVIAEPGMVVTSFVAQGPRTVAHEERLGGMLAALHTSRAPSWGGGSSFVGACPVRPEEWGDAEGFYSSRLMDLARRCGLTAQVAPVASRLGALVALDSPAVVHGDLWWGNILWGADGRPWLIDPSVHGGHPEEDLAMLALFGRIPERTLGAYKEVRPLNGGWEERVPLFQLYPLLVHTVLFGGAYRQQVDAVLGRFR